VSAQDDTGRVSTIERAFSLNDTLGFLRLRPSLLRVGRARSQLVVTVRLARPARVVLSIETKNGTVLRRITRSARAGAVSLAWNGRTARGGLVYTGSYVARVRALNAAGTMELQRPFAVQRPFRVPKRKPAKPPSRS
jgi:hypothetical protein